MNSNLRDITIKIERLKDSIVGLQKEISDIEDLGHVVVVYSSQTLQDYSTDRYLEWRMNVPHATVLDNLEKIVIEHTIEIKKLLVAIRAEALGE